MQKNQVEPDQKILSLPNQINPKPVLRSKTSLRMKYEAECSIIRNEIGSLEDIRKTLGLSRRKMCQILLVDPSTWTRWTQNESKVPPFVFRSLQWYLALIEKKPIWHPQNVYHGTSFQTLSNKRIEILEQKLESTLKKLQQSKKNPKKNIHPKAKQKPLGPSKLQFKPTLSFLIQWVKLKLKI